MGEGTYRYWGITSTLCNRKKGSLKNESSNVEGSTELKAMIRGLGSRKATL